MYREKHRLCYLLSCCIRTTLEDHALPQKLLLACGSYEWKTDDGKRSEVRRERRTGNKTNHSRKWPEHIVRNMCNPNSEVSATCNREKGANQCHYASVVWPPWDPYIHDGPSVTASQDSFSWPPPAPNINLCSHNKGEELLPRNGILM